MKYIYPLVYFLLFSLLHPGGDVCLVLNQLVAHCLLCIGSNISELRYAVDYICHKIEAVQIVQDTHVKRSRRSPFFLISPDMEILMVRPPVRQSVDQPRIPVVGKDNRFFHHGLGHEKPDVPDLPRWPHCHAGR